MSQKIRTTPPSWTHYFIDRPFWALSWACLILLLGLQSYWSIQVRQFPFIPSGVIRITATYPGADQQLVQSSVTTPLQRAIAQSEGFDYIQSTTQDGISVIDAHLSLGQDIDKVFPSVLSSVQSAKRSLPTDIDDPILTKGRGNSIALMYVAYTLDSKYSLHPSEIYQYLNTVIRPQLLTVKGVGDIEILGAQPLAARVWLDSECLDRYGVSIDQVTAALEKENTAFPGGFLETHNYRQSLRLKVQSENLNDLGDIIIKNSNNANITLRDLGQIELGGNNQDSEVIFNGNLGVFMSIDSLPNANALTVVEEVKIRLKELEKHLPQHLRQKIVYDATVFIQKSIQEVFKTLVEATVIVIVMIYFCLGSLRAVIVPLVAIPLSLVGVLIIMPIMGMSLNLLTLLAMILAIGLVVDDAILVVEHTVHYRSITDSPFLAAKQAISSLQSPLIVMTLILAVAYLPLAFLEGLTGALFKEFALTLSGAVIISGLVALIISPVLSAYLLPSQNWEQPVWLKKLTVTYSKTLSSGLKSPRPLLYLAAMLYPFTLVFFAFLPQDLAPKEDQGFALFSYQGPKTATLGYTRSQASLINPIIKNESALSEHFFIHGASGVSGGIGGLIGQPWNQRSHNMEKISADFSKNAKSIEGLEIYSFTPSPLPGPDGLPVQFVIYGPHSPENLFKIAQNIRDKLWGTGFFPFLTTDLKINKINQLINFKRDFIVSSGHSTAAMAKNIALNLSDIKNSSLSYQNELIDVRVRQKDRDISNITNNLGLFYHDEAAYHLDDIAQVSFETAPNALYQFNQMNSITIQGVLFPFATLGDVFSKTQTFQNDLKKQGCFIDYTGPTRAFVQEGNKLVITGIIALVVMYLVLMALFESFLDPFLILMTVPLALCSAVGCMNLSCIIAAFSGLHSLAVNFNIYTQLGMLTLLGLITKHGILLVDVAKKLQKQGISIDASMEQAAHERFRPILMTTAAMVMGVVPLLFATGPGAQSRFHLGFVLAFGLSLGTLFTLFVFPILYITLSKKFSYISEKKIPL